MTSRTPAGLWSERCPPAARVSGWTTSRRCWATPARRALAYAALSGDRLGELVSLVEGGAASAGGVMTFMSVEASYAVPQADVDVSVSLVATWELLPP